MGIFAGPGVIEDGLVLALDAANQKSHNLTAVEVLVVAGGGGGGARHAGGGGGGGVIYNSNFAVTPGSALTVTVGDGGIGGTETSGWGISPVSTNGSNSVFGSLTAIGGGAGGYASAGNSGGSGGGGGDGSGGTLLGGSGTSGQGSTGGNSGSGSYVGGGGGGGAGGIGGNGSNRGGDGGPGLGFNISGTFTYYGGGGGGAAGYNKSSLGGAGGLGGGGRGDNSGSVGTICQNGTSNTGGGGGAHSTNYPTAGSGKAGNGGSGIVIVRYPGPQKAIGGTVTSVNGYTIHTFTDVGSTTFTPLAATNNSAILGLSDLSGRNNFATSANGPTYDSSNRGSIVFDGVNDKVTFPNNTISTSAGITVEVWFKTSSGTKYQDIFDLSDTYGVWIVTNYGGQTGKIMTSFSTTSGYMTANYSVNTWYQVVLSGSGTSNFMYLNGVQVATGTRTVASSINLNTARIGNVDGDRASEYLVGNVSCLKLYNRALTATEIQKNFNAQRGRFGI